MRTWTEADRIRHGEIMRAKLLERRWEPWANPGDRTNSRFNALRHGRYSQASLEQRKLKKQLRMVMSQLADQVSQNLQYLRSQDFDRISSPDGVLKRVQKTSKHLSRVNSEVADLLEYRKKRRKK